MCLVLIIPLCHAFIFLGPGICLSRFLGRAHLPELWLLLLHEAASEHNGSAGIRSWKSTEKFSHYFDLNVLRARFLPCFTKYEQSSPPNVSVKCDFLGFRCLSVIQTNTYVVFHQGFFIFSAFLLYQCWYLLTALTWCSKQLPETILEVL